VRVRVTALTLLLAGALQAGDVLVVKAARAYPVSGKAIAPCVIVVRDGKIARVVPELAEIPEGATVLSAATVMPGMIDAMSSMGLSGPRDEESREVAPRVRVVDLFDPTSRDRYLARSRGITIAHVEPGTDNVIGGFCGLVKTYGAPDRRLVLTDQAALKAVIGLEPSRGNRSSAWGPPQSMFFRRPTTRMAVIHIFRETFDRARDALSGGTEVPPELAPVVRVLKGELPLRVHAGRVIDVRVLLKESERLGVTPVMEDGWEAYKEAAALAAAGIPVVLTPAAAGLLRPAREGDVRLDNAALLDRSGVKIAFGTGGEDIDLRLVAAMAVRHGLDEEAALRALTLGPAEILGIAKERGSLEKGKAADLVLLSGPPLGATSRVVKVIGEGTVVFPEGGDGNGDGKK
jgi:imidazolonepropionase-like amidohydrolase